ncbi:MAG: ATP-binding protein [Chloroflexota bacterium]
MIPKPFNRLWVRFSVAIASIIFIANVIPASSLLLPRPRDTFNEMVEYVEYIDHDADLALTSDQINGIAQELAIDVRSELRFDAQFLTITTLLVALVAGVFLGRGLSSPIEKLATATKAVGARNLNHRVKVEGPQELRELAQNFNHMTEELARSENARRNMLADVSHELLTPLTVLQANLIAILDGVYELNNDEIGNLYEQNKHLIKLVQDLRLLSQTETGNLPFELTAVNLSHLVKEVTTFFELPAAEKSITVRSALSNKLPEIEGDINRLRQVIHNIMSNALRHTPQGGRISIETTKTSTEILLIIVNSGNGINPDLLPYLFDRYYRTAESRRSDSGGVGLGLAICKALVEAHNGRINAKNLPNGEGAQFTISLPIK